MRALAACGSCHGGDLPSIALPYLTLDCNLLLSVYVTHIYIYIYTYIYIYVYMYLYMCMCMCMVYIYIYACIYMYTYMSRPKGRDAAADPCCHPLPIKVNKYPNMGRVGFLYSES